MEDDSRSELGLLKIAVTAASALGLLGLFLAWLQRDPDRVVPADENLVVSPADGLVTAIERMGDGELGTRVCIFLSLLDVHVNRAPVAGRITDIQYRSGRFGTVLLGRASAENEQNRVHIEGSHTAVVFVQIAGMLARRIVFERAVGDWVERGERIGAITFGSQVDVYLGAEVELLVRRGQRVKGGVTPVARQRAIERIASA